MPSDITRRDFLKWGSLSTVGGVMADGLGRSLPFLPGAEAKGRRVLLTTADGALCSSPNLTLIQSPWLAMVALGDNKMPDPLKGNHLRWAFEPVLGVPPQGFDLFRRQHLELACTTVTLPKPTGATMGGNQNWGRRLVIDDLVILANDADLIVNYDPALILDGHTRISIVFHEACAHVQLRVVDSSPDAGARGKIRARAMDRGVTVATDLTDAALGSASSQLLDLAADRIDQVVIEALGEGAMVRPMLGRLTEICRRTVSADLCPPLNPDSPNGWRQLNKDRICLPLSAPNYDPPCELLDEDQAWRIARRRVPPGAWPTAGPTRPVEQPGPIVIGPPDEFRELHQALTDVYNLDYQSDADKEIRAIDPTCPPADGVSETPPTYTPDPLGMVLLATIDANIARVLGLYWVDGAFSVSPLYDAEDALQRVEAAKETPYDYLIVGHYGDAAADPGVCARWHVGDSIKGTAYRGPLAYDAPTEWGVVARAVPVAGDTTDAALRLPDTKAGPLRITLPLPSATIPEPIRAVELFVDVPDDDSQAYARAYSHGVVVDEDKTPRGLKGPTSLFLSGEAIDVVELDGTNLYLAQTCFYRRHLPSGDIGWVCHNVLLGTATPLPAPTGVQAHELPVVTHFADHSVAGCELVASQMAAGLRWDRPVEEEATLPGRAVAHDIERQFLGDGDAAGPPDASKWLNVKENVTIGPSPDAECQPYESPADWPRVHWDYVDTPPEVPPARSSLTLSPRPWWYGFRVRAKDIFGRTSAFSGTAVVDLSDRVAPPPPAHVRAKYLDPDDRYLLSTERAELDKLGGKKHLLHLSWEWPPNLREQAPDAHHFQIHFKSGRINVVTGNIDAVGVPAADGSSADQRIELTTDLTLADLPMVTGLDPKNAFVGEMLSQGDTLYEVIESNIDKALFLTVRRLVLPPDAIPKPADPFPVPAIDYLDLPLTVVAPELQPMPAIGPFSLSVRAPQPLAGTITAVGGPRFMAAGEILGDILPTIDFAQVTVDTDLRFTGKADSLKGLRLRQGGTAWEILGNSMGWGIHLVVKRRPCEPVAPEDGVGFVVESPDGQPHLLDPGNLYWRDLANTVNWDTVLPPNKTDDLALTPSKAFWEMYLPIEVPLAIADGEPDAYALIGVSTVDQNGNEGQVSPPAVIVRRDQLPPATADAGKPGPVLWATPADYLGHSYFTVRWTKSAQRGLRYRIFRALMDPKDVENKVLPENLNYMLVTPEPLGVEDATDFTEPLHPADPNLLAYRDTLDGKSSGRYYYRIQTVNAAGVNRMNPDGTPELSAPIGPVACPDVVPPRAPVITKVLGEEKKITLRWVPNRDDVAEYRVYRAESEDAAQDLRTMTLAHTAKSPFVERPECPGELCWTDTTIHALARYYYRIFAVDRSGNTSQASALLRGQAFDDALPVVPSLSVTWSGEPLRAVANWIAADDTMLERRPQIGAVWSRVTDWLTPGTHVVSEDVDTAVSWSYRLRVRKATGALILGAPMNLPRRGLRHG